MNDSAIALTCAMLLFVLPSNQKSSHNALEVDELVHQHKGLLTWKDTIKMEWGILLMFGGGIALAKQLQSAGLLSRLGNALAGVTPDNLFLITWSACFNFSFLKRLYKYRPGHRSESNCRKPGRITSPFAIDFRYTHVFGSFLFRYVADGYSSQCDCIWKRTGTAAKDVTSRLMD
ncbi:MAG: anion permease [Saprospiraceae bacterium]